MKKLLALAGLMVLSLALFVGVFSVVHRPLVVGEIQKQLDYKMAYARTLTSPKIVILAGSNGRYSHRCEMLSAALQRPCVNASIGVGIGLDFQLSQWRPLLHRGDLVYMPLEYAQYRYARSDLEGGLQNALLVHSHRDLLWSLGAQRVAAAYGSFDLPFLLHGLAEMALERRGFQRRSSTETLTVQGDETGHTAQRAVAYASLLRTQRSDGTAVRAASDAIAVIEAFLRQARADGIQVVGGLPTIPDSVPEDGGTVERLQSLYESQGQRFLVMANHSRYPLGCFYDSLNHLTEECQRTHSAAVAALLATITSAPSSDAP